MNDEGAMISEDDEFESYEEEGETDLDRIRATLIAVKEANAPFDLAADRIAGEKRAANQPMPDGWTATPLDLGRPAWKLNGPGAKDTRTILHLFGGGYCLGSLASRAGPCRADRAGRLKRILTCSIIGSRRTPVPRGV
ncbi:MAG: hypothetical protein WDN76_02585 [Alphaproteobacteria bacterium]